MDAAKAPSCPPGRLGFAERCYRNWRSTRKKMRLASFRTMFGSYGWKLVSAPANIWSGRPNTIQMSV
jgi:hypothetical protein